MFFFGSDAECCLKRNLLSYQTNEVKKSTVQKFPKNGNAYINRKYMYGKFISKCAYDNCREGAL